MIVGFVLLSSINNINLLLVDCCVTLPNHHPPNHPPVSPPPLNININCVDIISPIIPPPFSRPPSIINDLLAAYIQQRRLFDVINDDRLH